MEFLVLLLAHFVADFYLQTDKMAKEKESNLNVHLLHHLVLTCIALLVLWIVNERYTLFYHVLFPALLLLFFHWFIDFFKINAPKMFNVLKKRNLWQVTLFITDQLLHVVSVLIVSWFFFNIDFIRLADNLLVLFQLSEGEQPTFSTINKILFLFIMFIAATTITGHLIRILLGTLTNHLALFEGKYTIKDELNNGEYLNKGYNHTNITEELTYMVIKKQDLSRGKIIGYLERLLVIILIVSGSLRTIAFIIAAKSLARFKQLDDRDWAEYFLLGTLTSIFLAIIYGLIIKVVLS